MIPPALSLYFDLCQSGGATAKDYAKALHSVQAAFDRNQDVAAQKARSLRADYVPSNRRRVDSKPYTDRQHAAAGDR